MMQKKGLQALFFILAGVFAARVWQISFLGIEAIRIGFGSLFIILGGLYLGPWWGALVGGSIDILGFLLQPGNGVDQYLPQITFVSILWGMWPWYLLKWRRFSTEIKDLFFVIGIPQAVFSIGFMSMMISLHYSLPLMTLVRSRFTAQLVTIPVYVMISYIIFKNRQLTEDLYHEKGEQALLLDTIDVQIWYLKDEATYGRVNQSHIDFLGAKREEVENRDLYEITSTEKEAETCIKGNREVFMKKKKIKSEEWIIDGHGERRLLSIIKSPKLNEVGDVEYVVCYAIDSTEQKEMERQLQYQHEFQRVVANISSRFINTPRAWIHESIENTLSQIGHFFSVDRAYFFQFSLDGLMMSNTYEWCREGIDPQKDLIQDAPVENVSWMMGEILSKEYVFIPDINTLEHEEERREFQRQGIQSLLCIPIRVNDRVIGFIGIDSVRRKMIWSEEEITLLRVISGIMSSALSKHQTEEELYYRTQELDREIEKALKIHTHTLPTSLPSIPNLSFAVYYKPAERIGGDFYDVIHVGQKLILYLLDVSGHGLDGSMLSVFVKHTIRGFLSFSPQKSITPSSILHYLVTKFREEDYPEEYLISIFLGVLDLESMELMYAGGGFQDTPFVWIKRGEETQLQSRGLFLSPLISMDLYTFPEKRIVLTPGTTLFFNTDGLSEEKRSGVLYRDRLSHIFYKNAYLPPTLISQAVVEDFRQFNNGSLQGQDDITFFVMQVKPEEKERLDGELTHLQELDGLHRQVIDLLTPSQETFTLRTCLTELVANAIEHGNSMDSNKRVSIEIIRFEEYIQVSIEDEGEGFLWQERIDGSLDLRDYKVRGRGIAMTKMLCDGLFYNEKGNRVTCIVKRHRGIEEQSLISHR